MKKTKILALGLAALMGLAAVKAGAVKAPSPSLLRRRAPAAKTIAAPTSRKSTGRFTPYGRKIFLLTSAWITSLKSIRLR